MPWHCHIETHCGPIIAVRADWQYTKRSRQIVLKRQGLVVESIAAIVLNNTPQIPGTRSWCSFFLDSV
jgi:hypothetical protein